MKIPFRTLANRLLSITSLLAFLPSRRVSAAPGSYDTGFGDGGGVTVSMADGDDFGQAVAIQRDGKLLVAGGSAAGDYSVLRLLANGKPDPDFGNAGKVVRDFGLFELARGVAQRADGTILVGGSGLIFGGSRDFAVLCLLSNGTPDPSYGSGGLVSTDIKDGFNEPANCMVVDAEGRATLGGSYRANVALVRYTPTGTLDESFGIGGKVYTENNSATEELIQGMALQSINFNTTKVKGDARPTFEGHLALPGTEAERPFALWVRQTKTGGVMLTGKSGQPKGSAIEQIVGLLGSKGSRTPDLTVGESKLTLKPGELVLFENKPKEPNEKSPTPAEPAKGPRPDFYGWLHTGEPEHGLLDVAVWAKTDANGRAYLTGSLQEPGARQDQRQDAEPEMAG